MGLTKRRAYEMNSEEESVQLGWICDLESRVHRARTESGGCKEEYIQGDAEASACTAAHVSALEMRKTEAKPRLCVSMNPVTSKALGRQLSGSGTRLLAARTEAGAYVLVREADG